MSTKGTSMFARSAMPRSDARRSAFRRIALVHRLLMPSAALLASVSLACDDGTAPTETMTVEEAEAMLVGLLQIPAADPTRLALVAETPDGFVMACPAGGELAVAFYESADQLEVGLTLDPVACAYSQDRRAFTIEGNPNIEMTFKASSVEPIALEIRVSGGVDWQMDDVSGTCVIDLAGGIGDEANFSGTVCGHEVTLAAEVLLPPVVLPPA